MKSAFYIPKEFSVVCLCLSFIKMLSKMIRTALIGSVPVESFRFIYKSTMKNQCHTFDFYASGIVIMENCVRFKFHLVRARIPAPRFQKDYKETPVVLLKNVSVENHGSLFVQGNKSQRARNWRKFSGT